MSFKSLSILCLVQPLCGRTRWGDNRSLQVLLVRLLRAADISSRYDTANGVITYKDERGKAQILQLMQEELRRSRSECRLSVDTDLQA